MPGKLSTHVLDTVNGCPANGMKIELLSIANENRRLLASVRTNAEGRTDSPLLFADKMAVGEYELVFFAGEYFAARMSSLPAPLFLDKVPVRFGIADARASYHVPLIVGPWGYSTYRGS
ncbi:MAG TPA: hydroxyisourate hydrolase [Candidatus Sulfotelmatobacter sp.]|nr:hydroxyisourate hydrolase [Candidatus Sulfotelmatobacter sp.]